MSRDRESFWIKIFLFLELLYFRDIFKWGMFSIEGRFYVESLNMLDKAF